MDEDQSTSCCENSENRHEEITIFCQNIGVLREWNGLSQKEMAKILGIGVVSLAKMEQGIIPPRGGIEVIFRLSQYFKIELHKLVMPL